MSLSVAEDLLNRRPDAIQPLLNPAAARQALIADDHADTGTL
jgi:hypothetical protein